MSCQCSISSERFHVVRQLDKIPDEMLHYPEIPVFAVLPPMYLLFPLFGRGRQTFPVGIVLVKIV